MNDEYNIPTETLAETEHYVAWTSEEPDGEQVYHLDLGQVTFHFFHEEWAEFLELMKAVAKG